MTDSILDSVKLALSINPDYDAYDSDIIMHINSVFSILHQVGASPIDGFYVTDSSSTWLDYIGEAQHVNMVKSYVVLRVRLLFDPPSSAFALDSMERQAKELEWRLSCLDIQFNPTLTDNAVYVFDGGSAYTEQ